MLVKHFYFNPMCFRSMQAFNEYFNDRSSYSGGVS